MLLARLRWSAFGLRGRIVGAVLATTAISLGVAALVLLPRLETSLKNASKTSLLKAISRNHEELRKLDGIRYWLIPEYEVISQKNSPVKREAHTAANRLLKWESAVKAALSVQSAALCAPLDAVGDCAPVVPSTNQADATALAEINAVGPLSWMVKRAYVAPERVYPAFSPDGGSVLAAIYLKDANAVLVVRNSISEVGAAVAAVRSAFLI